jgi:glycosyltransferase involved in cell wall biosynthesis
VTAPRIAVVIPCYRVKRHVLDVIGRIGAECSAIYVVDDCCPEQSGSFVASHARDPRVVVLYHEKNAGVGGAVMTGYQAALRDGAEIIVKVDGDGQMDPRLIPIFVAPILRGEADYTKGNRFFSLYNVRKMPRKRLFGNAVLSFMTKISSGYWSIFDPTNGYTAAHHFALRQIEFKNVSTRYFFESDMLINLGGFRAVVVDIPLVAIYEGETSNLKISDVLLEFLAKHLRETVKRVAYSYFLRDFSLASLNLLGGLALLMFGAIFGLVHWWQSADSGVVATTGTVMLAVLPIILGFQLLLSFLAYDIANEPRAPLQRFAVPPTALARGLAEIAAEDSPETDAT